MEVNAVEPQGRKVSGLIGDYKKVKEYKKTSCFESHSNCMV